MAIQEAGTLLARSMPSSATSRLHGLQRLKSEVEAAIELGLLGDGARQLGLHGGALASREAAAAQFGPELLDVIVKRDHRALLV